MREIFNELNIHISEEQAEKFEIYYRLLTEYNAKFNITAIQDKREVYIKHFADSLLGSDLLISGKLLDVGSGGGFPAVPLKILRDDISLTMLEATGKKCVFLNALCSELGLKNVKVINGRAEELGKDLSMRESFDCCTSRAVARFNVLLEYCVPFVKVGGVFLAYKANAEQETEEGKNALNVLGARIKDISEFSLFGAKREIIRVEKINSTDKKYPRVGGKIKKNPL